MGSEVVRTPPPSTPSNSIAAAFSLHTAGSVTLPMGEVKQPPRTPDDHSSSGQRFSTERLERGRDDEEDPASQRCTSAPPVHQDAVHVGGGSMVVCGGSQPSVGPSGRRLCQSFASTGPVVNVAHSPSPVVGQSHMTAGPTPAGSALQAPTSASSAPQAMRAGILAMQGNPLQQGAAGVLPSQLRPSPQQQGPMASPGPPTSTGTLHTRQSPLRGNVS